MRLLMTNLLATALVLIGATTASAFATNMTNDYLGQDLDVGNQVTVEIFFDATAPLTAFLSVGVQYDPTLFAFVPASHASTGTPSYLLYGMVGSAMTAMNTWMTPQQDPWQTWPGSTNPPGVGQVNINFADETFVGAGGTGLVKIGQVTLQVIATGGPSTIALTSVSGGNILSVAGVTIANPTSGDFQVTFVPEPTTAVLVGLGLLGLGVAGRRRA